MEYWRLIRPKIIAMVLFGMAIAAWTAGTQPVQMAPLLHALLGTGVLIAGAISLNQRIEYRSDSRMRRTATRPLPSGNLSTRQVTRFGLICSLAGLGYLVAFCQPLLAILAASSWAVYVLTYTPLKSRSVWQTPVGALAGALPMLLGAAAADALLSLMAFSLFAIAYFWQFPHSMAIAWLYREQFALAETRLATVVDPSGRMAGLLAVGGAVVLLPIGLIPLLSSAGLYYGIVAVLLGLGYLVSAVCFLRETNDTTARRMLRASFIYLPGVLLALLI